MARIAISLLELAVDRAERVTSARFRLEEALRLGVDDDGVRVLVIRRLALGRLPGRWTRAGEWTARVEARMRDLTQHAVHALSPTAAQSDSVYFRSELEARTALAALLAAGRRPIGWFWLLVVPVWSGQDWIVAAPALLRDLLVRPGGKVAFARLMVRALHDGFAVPLFAPVTEATMRTLWPELMQREAGGEPVEDAVPGTPAPQAASASRRALESLSPSAIGLFQRLLLETSARPFLQRMLAALVVLGESPHVLATPSVLATTADAVLAVAASSAPHRARIVRISDAIQSPAAATTRTTGQASTPGSRNRQAHGEEPPSVSAPRDPSLASVALIDGPAPIAAKSLQESAPEPWEERRSQGAGLFLLIQPLARLGLAGWLERHPDATADGFAWALLRDIARRMRVPLDDPLWSLMTTAVPEARADWICAWRVGLDRWLRRRTRCKLAAVVRRPGWLRGDDTATVVRFPLAAADIRLRRLALDVDPGWVPWLGRSVTFLYRDRLTE